MTERLVASYWTIAGAPFGEPARWSLGARMRAAAEAGFWGIGLHYQDYLANRERGLSDGEMLRLLEASGIVVDEIEFLTGWSSDDEAVRQRASIAESHLLAMAQALGARQLNAGCSEPLGDLPDMERVAERFAGVCERAAVHGLQVALEFLPWSGIPDAATAWEVVRGSGCANGGALLDAWHYFRGNPAAEALRAIPAERIIGLQMSDGPAAPSADLREEARTARLLPGEGDFALAALVGQLDEIGVAAPWAVEVMSARQALLPVRDAARAAYEAASRVLAGARRGG